MLDRHWRNARTISSHNPRVYKARMLGDWHLNGADPLGRKGEAEPSMSQPPEPEPPVATELDPAELERLRDTTIN